jgi:hypothetical protein
MAGKRKHTGKKAKQIAQEKKRKPTHHKRVKQVQDLPTALHHFEEVMQATHGGWWMP